MQLGYKICMEVTHKHPVPVTCHFPPLLCMCVTNWVGYVDMLKTSGWQMTTNGQQIKQWPHTLKF